MLSNALSQSPHRALRAAQSLTDLLRRVSQEAELHDLSLTRADFAQDFFHGLGEHDRLFGCRLMTDGFAPGFLTGQMRDCLLSYIAAFGPVIARPVGALAQRN